MDNMDKCNCCREDFAFGVSYECFICGGKACIKHFVSIQDMEICFGCYAEDFILNKHKTDLIEN